MTVVNAFTLKCDKCQGESDESHTSITELQLYRRSEGWTVTSSKGAPDVCPECNGTDVKYWTFPPKGDDQ